MSAAPDITPLLTVASRAARLQAMNLRVDGVPFNLGKYPYLVPYLDDEHPRICALKGAQLGWTIATILKTIDSMMRDPLRGALYLFPTERDVSDFSKARFSRILYENPVLQAAIRDTDAVNIKQIGEGYVYFRGAGSTSGLKSIPVDRLAKDEVDEMEPVKVELVNHRLDASEDPRDVEFSTPTIPEYGVDLAYKESNGYRWMVRCLRCNTWNCLEEQFPDVFEPAKGGGYFYACKKCRRELVLRGGELEAEMVAAYRGRDVHGYWVSQLNSPSVMKTATRIHAEWESAQARGQLREFYNSVLGLAFAEVDDALTDDVIYACCTSDPRATRSDKPTAMGIDPGKNHFHWWVERWETDTISRTLSFGVCREWDEITQLRKRFQVEVTVIDEMAETRSVRRYKESHPSVWGCWYQDERKGPYDWNDDSRQVTVNRTESLDESHARIVGKLVRLPRRDERLEHLAVPQLKNVARIVKTDEESGKKRIRWVVRGGTKNDHLAHARNYCTIALERLSKPSKSTRHRRKPGRSFMAR